MAVPGLKHDYTVRAKVRIGKRQGAGATSVDHFLSDDPELAQLFGEKPSSILIRFPHASVEDSFSTGLEWWVQRRSDKKNQLACYTKDGGSKPVALRMEPYLSGDEEIVGEKRPGKNGARLPILCPVRDCPVLKKGSCKPMGRLVFFLEGGRTDAVLELDTKSWNSIERLEPVLANAGDLRGRTWELSVAFESKGTKRFPVLSIKEVGVNVNNEQDAKEADALLPLLAAVTEGSETDREDRVRIELAGALDVTNPGWRDNPKFIERIREVGPITAATGLLKKNELWPE